MFDHRFDYIPLKALKQHWMQTSFSYLEKPRPDYGIMLVLNGRMDFMAQGMETIRAAGGDILFLPKNTHYEVRFYAERGPVDNYLVNFETNQQFACNAPMLLSKNASIACEDVFVRFIDNVYKTGQMDFRNKGLFYMLLEAVCAQTEMQKSATFNVVERAKKLLAEPQRISLKQIAKMCSVSESGLRKLFSDTLGISPVQYRHKEMLNRAKHLLESTDMSVGEIADALDFYDAAYFCRIFRQYTGVAPKVYRQNKTL